MMDHDVPRYRLMALRQPLAPWRPTLQDAQADAIAQGMADWDHTHRVLYLTVPARIEVGAGPPIAPIARAPVPDKRSFRRRRMQPLRRWRPAAG